MKKVIKNENNKPPILYIKVSPPEVRSFLNAVA
jgi:hypothetical protein